MKIRKLLISLLSMAMIGVVALGMASCEDGGSKKGHKIEAGIENSSDINDGDYDEDEDGSQGLEYKLADDGTYYTVISRGTCWDTEIVIPSKHKGLPVKRIGCEAFYRQMDLISMTIGRNIEIIDDGAFWGCRGLMEIIMSNSVTNIGNRVFYSCVSLPEITLSNNLTTIGIGAFEGCESLTEITIPASVTSLDDIVFNNCENLTNITVEDNNPYYSSLNGNVYNKDQTEFIQYAVGKKETSFTIPNHVTCIDDYAFYFCQNLTEIIIPNSVTTIEEYAFSCCSMTEISVPGSVKSIGDWAFSVCVELTSVELGEGVKSIGDEAFRGCEALTEIVLPNSLKSIGSFAFNTCLSLKEIVIPRNVSSIGDAPFYWCIKLTNITVDVNNADYSSSDGNLYNKDKTQFIQYALGKTDTSLTIPDGVRSIGNSAFVWNENLRGIYIPNTVTSIGDYAFCDSYIESITFNGNVEEWNAIDKGEDWNGYMSARVVTCIDGDVILREE